MAPLVKDIIPRILDVDDWKIGLARHWEQVVGTLQTRIRLEKIFDDTVVIGVYESHWMQELYLLSSVLRDSINRFLGEHRINHLRFTLVEERKRTVRKPQSKKFIRPKHVSLSLQQEKALKGIPDEKLRTALIDYWSRCTVYETRETT